MVCDTAPVKFVTLVEFCTIATALQKLSAVSEVRTGIEGYSGRKQRNSAGFKVFLAS